GHVDLRRLVDVEVADALEMGEDRHARFVLYALDQRAPAARHDHVYVAAEALQHLANGGAVGGGHQLDRILGQAGGFEPLDQAGVDRLRRIGAVGAATQNHGITRLEAERAGISRHVWAALVDDADDAERRPY